MWYEVFLFYLFIFIKIQNIANFIQLKENYFGGRELILETREDMFGGTNSVQAKIGELSAKN